MTVQNRESFLAAVASRLNRHPSTTRPERRWQYSPQSEVLKNKTQDELVQILIEQCTNIHTTAKTCTAGNLPETLMEAMEGYGGGAGIYSRDQRFEELGLASLLARSPAMYEWDHEKDSTNIEMAEQANIGIVVSDITLAESGTIVVQTSQNNGRTLSYLPSNSIAIVPKSTIVPRMTQAAQQLRSRPAASSIHFITGPSNSADIEMKLVVGVHGPIRMTYIIVEDR
ncbi:MAG: lactate utilization protein C [Lysinibacillus sp.]